MIDGGLVVSLFAGRGGACDGIQAALGIDPDVAINHDATALAVHRVVHPNTQHLRGDVWHYAPKDVTRGKPVGLLWASPTCCDFSKAKGAPLDRRAATKTRALAWVVTRWARDAKPGVIIVENVEAFQQWDVLTNAGKPCPKRRGRTFRKWVRSLEREGYTVDWRMLRASDFGSPTSRRRLFIVARCDGASIHWPTPTHGSAMWETPFRSAAECIDFSRPSLSIFDSARRKPLAAAALRRIARGVRKFVVDAAAPYIIDTATGRCVPHLVHVANGERKGQAPRIYDIRQPLGTVVAGGVKHALVCVFIAKNYGGHVTPGQSVRSPLGTVTTRDHHALIGVEVAQRAASPEVLAFLAAHDLPAQVTLDGELFDIVDITYRLLEPDELAKAHDLTTVAIDADGKKVTKTAQIRLIGNSVPMRLARAVVGACFEQRAMAA